MKPPHSLSYKYFAILFLIEFIYGSSEETEQFLWESNVISQWAEN